jgi:hypothetical protein
MLNYNYDAKSKDEINVIKTIVDAMIPATYELIFDPGGGEDVECHIFSFFGHKHLVYHTLKVKTFYSGLLWKSQWQFFQS